MVHVLTVLRSHGLSTVIHFTVYVVCRNLNHWRSWSKFVKFVNTHWSGVLIAAVTCSMRALRVRYVLNARVTAVYGCRPRSNVCERGDGLKNLALKACYGRRRRTHARFLRPFPGPRSHTFNRGRQPSTAVTCIVSCIVPFSRQLPCLLSWCDHGRLASLL